MMKATRMMWISRCMWIALGLAAGGAGGCGKGDSGPPCTKVAEHVAEVVAKQYPGHVEMMSDSVRKTWVASCQAHKLTGQQRQCMMDAKTSEGLSACLPREKPDEKVVPTGGVPVPVTPPAGATPPPAGATPPSGATPPPVGATPPAAPAPGVPTTPAAPTTPATPATPAPAK
jgi:hypothetical protein